MNDFQRRLVQLLREGFPKDIANDEIINSCFFCFHYLIAGRTHFTNVSIRYSATQVKLPSQEQVSSYFLASDKEPLALATPETAAFIAGRFYYLYDSKKVINTSGEIPPTDRDFLVFHISDGFFMAISGKKLYFQTKNDILKRFDFIPRWSLLNSIQYVITKDDHETVDEVSFDEAPDDPSSEASASGGVGITCTTETSI